MFLLSSAAAQGKFNVEWKDCRLTVSAEQASLSQILTDVARKTGIRVTGLEELPERGSFAFSKVPLGQGLDNLLSGLSYAITNEPSCADSAATTVVVFGRKSSPPDDSSSVSTDRAFAKSKKNAVGDAARTKNEQAKKTAASDEEEHRLRDALLDSDPNVRTEALDRLAKRLGNKSLDTLLSAAASDDSALRQRGLELLSQSTEADPAAVLPAFSEALKDEDPNVRALAVQTLATQGGSDGIELLRQAFSAADCSVKALIVETLGSTADAIPLLQEASTDSDESIRNSASALLQEAISEEDDADAVTSPVNGTTAPSPPPRSVDRTQNPARPPGGR
jgi:hypothetical protein